MKKHIKPMCKTVRNVQRLQWKHLSKKMGRKMREAIQPIRARLRELYMAERAGWNAVGAMQGAEALGATKKWNQRMGKFVLAAAQQKSAGKKSGGAQGGQGNSSAQKTQPFRKGPRGGQANPRGPCFQCGVAGHVVSDNACKESDIQAHIGRRMQKKS